MLAATNRTVSPRLTVIVGRREAHRVRHVDADRAARPSSGRLPGRTRSPRPCWHRTLLGLADCCLAVREGALRQGQDARSGKQRRICGSWWFLALDRLQWPLVAGSACARVSVLASAFGPRPRAPAAGTSPVNSRATRAGRMAVPARVLVAAARLVVADLDDAEHAAHLHRRRRARCRSSSAACCRAAASPSRPCRPCPCRPSPCSRERAW